METQLDFSRLAALQSELPTTLMAKLRLAWPEIKAALERGHSLKVIHGRVNESGIAISYRRLSFYIGRLRRTDATRGLPSTGRVAVNAVGQRSRQEDHPLAAESTNSSATANEG